MQSRRSAPHICPPQPASATAFGFSYPPQGFGRHGPILDTPLQDFNAQACFWPPLLGNPAFSRKSKSKTYIFKSLTKRKTLYFLLKRFVLLLLFSLGRPAPAVSSKATLAISPKKTNPPQSTHNSPRPGDGFVTTHTSTYRQKDRLSNHRNLNGSLRKCNSLLSTKMKILHGRRTQL